MRKVRQAVTKIGFMAIGVGAGVILAAGSGLAAVHMSQTAATEHSIDAVQTAAAGDDRVHPEDASPSATPRSDDDATEPARQGEPEPADDSTNRAASTDDSTSHSGSTGSVGPRHDDTSASRSPEPVDDSGRHGSR
jgi:hypothetical protein